MNITARVNQNRISENQYRSLKEVLSYSSIKLFDNDRKAFFQQIVMGEPKREKESIAITLGSLVHLLLSEPEAFDEKYVIANYVKPGGQIGELCDELMIRSMKSTVDGIPQDKFEVLFQDAVNVVKYEFDGVTEKAFKKKNLDTIVKMFVTKYNKEGKAVNDDEDGVSAEMYYQDCMKCIGRTVVSMATIESAEKIVTKIKEHPYTADIANLQTTEDVECFNELPILFELNGVPYRSMVDKLVVDHQMKTIKLYDWKTTWDIQQPQFSYLKYGYYLQTAMYRDAVHMWCKEHELTGYKIEPMTFVFCDTQGFADPVLLELSIDDIERAHRGFTYRGLHYNGLRYLQEEIQWCLDTGKWGSGKELEKNNGKIKLKLRYGSQ